MDPLKMYFLLNMVIFHCYVSLPEGRVFLMMNLLHSGFGRAHNFRASLGVSLVTTESTQVCPLSTHKVAPYTIVINGVITPRSGVVWFLVKPA